MAPKIALCITIFTLLTGFTIIGKPPSPPARNVHVIVAATPTTDAIPKHKPKVLIESFPGARVHTHLVYSKVVAEMGKCTGEAAPYLKGIIDLKETLNGDDIALWCSSTITRQRGTNQSECDISFAWCSRNTRHTRGRILASYTA